jgi:transcriptional regulator with XRE-family HTH domain
MNDQELTKKVGSRIRAERELSGYKIVELAERIGLSESYLSRIERGERPIDIDLIERIAQTLDIRAQTLMDFSRDEVVAFARTASGGRDQVTDWTLDVLADMRFAETEVQSRGW